MIIFISFIVFLCKLYFLVISGLYIFFFIGFSYILAISIYIRYLYLDLPIYLFFVIFFS